MFQHVLVAFDHSAAALRALDTAAAIAARTGARLTVAHVAAPPVEEPLDRTEAVAMELLGTEDHLRWTARLAGAVAALPPGLQARARVPVEIWRGEEMLRLADEVGADLVVSGAHRVGGPWASVRDAVPDRLLRDAGSAVLLVPDGPGIVDADAVVTAAIAGHKERPRDRASPIVVVSGKRDRLGRRRAVADAARALREGAGAVLRWPAPVRARIRVGPHMDPAMRLEGCRACASESAGSISSGGCSSPTPWCSRSRSPPWPSPR